MEPGLPIIGSDVVVRLSHVTSENPKSTAKIHFEYELYDIDAEAYIYIVRNNITRRLIKKITIKSDPQQDSLDLPTDGNYSFEITKEEYFDKYKGSFPVFKIRMEVADNPSINTESTEFKVIVY